MVDCHPLFEILRQAVLAIFVGARHCVRFAHPVSASFLQFLLLLGFKAFKQCLNILVRILALVTSHVMLRRSNQARIPWGSPCASKRVWHFQWAFKMLQSIFSLSRIPRLTFQSSKSAKRKAFLIAVIIFQFYLVALFWRLRLRHLHRFHLLLLFLDDDSLRFLEVLPKLEELNFLSHFGAESVGRDCDRVITFDGIATLAFPSTCFRLFDQEA